MAEEKRAWETPKLTTLDAEKLVARYGETSRIVADLAKRIGDLPEAEVSKVLAAEKKLWKKPEIEVRQIDETENTSMQPFAESLDELS